MPKGENNIKLSPEMWAQVVRDYQTPLPDGTWRGAKTLARQYGVTSNAVYYHLSRAGVPTRDYRAAHANGKRCKPITNVPPEGEPAPLCKCGCGESVAWNRRRNCWNVYVVGHYRQDAPYKHADWLRREYVVKHRTLDSIAAQCQVNRSTIIKFLDKFGILIRTQSESIKLSGAVKGNRNPAWNGGTTPERQRIYKTDAWKESVKAAYARDEYVCQRCGAPKTGPRGLHAHHLKAWAEHPELRTDMDNLVTLCKTCHTWVHSSANVDHEWLES